MNAAKAGKGIKAREEREDAIAKAMASGSPLVAAYREELARVQTKAEELSAAIEPARQVWIAEGRPQFAKQGRVKCLRKQRKPLR